MIKKKHVMIAIIVLILILTLSLHYRRKEETKTFLTECQEINKSGLYQLSQVVEPKSTCFNVHADNVVLDGNGIIVAGKRGAENAGISVFDSKNVTVKNFVIQDYETGIYAEISDNLLFYNNTLDRDLQGILLAYTNDSTVKENSITSSANIGLTIQDGKNNTLYNNTISSSLVSVDINGNLDNQIENNSFIHNLDSHLQVERNSSIGYVNQTIYFNLIVPPETRNCVACNYSISLYPSADFLYLEPNSNGDIGRFTPTQEGLYSLETSYIDEGNNKEESKYSFLISPSSEINISYYIRGTDPIHGQAHSYGVYGQDSGSLLDTPPNNFETRSCSDWIQISPDQLPSYLLGFVKGINFTLTYNASSNSINESVGIQQLASYDYSVDQSFSLPHANGNFVTSSFKFDTDWQINYYWQWYWQALKFIALGGNPTLLIDPSHPDTADINYIYPSTPAIKSESNNEVSILSATMKKDNSNIAFISLRDFRDDGKKGTLVIEMPDSSKNYTAYLNDARCNTNSCSIISQNKGVLSLSLDFHDYATVAIKPLS